LWIDDASVTLPTGIDQVLGEENGMEIFPNPSNGMFSIQQQSGTKQQTIEIYNILGEKIYSTTSDTKATYDIDISHSPKGIYFVKLNDGEKIQTEKIVVQ